MWSGKCTEFTRISAAALIDFYLQEYGAYLRAGLNDIVISLRNANKRRGAYELFSPKRGAYSRAARVVFTLGLLQL